MPELTASPSLDDDEVNDAIDFETAIAACGFGMFNIFLLLVATPGLMATLFETTTMSYVLPAAECDLQLTTFSKGLLNAMAFAGTLVSAVPWGFISDTYGRKRILVAGLLLNGISTFFSSMSVTAKQLMVFKFIGGFLSSGPVAVFLAYISEFHGKKHRSYIVVAIGMIKSLPLLVLPVLAYIILPQKIHFNVGSLEYNSWKLFIAVTAVPAIISGSLFTLFPESPKFLMSQGKNEEALKAFKIIYAINKCKKKNNYPINHLYNEAPEKTRRRSMRQSELNQGFSQRRKNITEKFQEGLSQMRPLCSAKYAGVAIMVYTMYFCLLFSTNSIRLWVPQHFATAKEMEYKGGYNLDTCSVLDYAANKTKFMSQLIKSQSKECEVHIEPDSYMSNIIVALSTFLTYVFTTLIMRLISNNIILRFYMTISSISLFAIYWSTSQHITLVLASIYVPPGIVSMTLILNASINVFPTSIRTMALIVVLSFGRLGAMVGNIILPLLIDTHCITIFLVYSGSILCSLMISYFIPNTTKENLK